MDQKETRRGREPACSHPRFQKEYLLGYGTGDYVCEVCKRVFTPDKVDEIERQNRESGTQ